MAKTLDTAAIETERKALELLVNELQSAEGSDRDNLQEAVKVQAEKLQKMCEQLQAEADKIETGTAENAQPDAVVEVVLTPEQRARVLAETGIDVPSIRIPDPNASLTKNMKFVTPDFIESRAIEQAKMFQKMADEAAQDISEEDKEAIAAAQEKQKQLQEEEK